MNVDDMTDEEFIDYCRNGGELSGLITERHPKCDWCGCTYRVGKDGMCRNCRVRERRRTDPEYERIDDIHDVCKGDIFVATNGNRFSVAAVDDDDKTNSTLAIMIQTEDPDSYAWMFNSTFAYALRPKPKLPDHDGLWLDKGDGLWLVTGTTVIEIAPKDPPAASISYPASSIEASERLSLFAPFRPAKAVEA